MSSAQARGHPRRRATAGRPPNEAYPCRNGRTRGPNGTNLWRAIFGESEEERNILRSSKSTRALCMFSDGCRCGPIRPRAAIDSPLARAVRTDPVATLRNARSPARGEGERGFGGASDERAAQSSWAFCSPSGWSVSTRVDGGTFGWAGSSRTRTTSPSRTRSTRQLSW